MTKKITLLGTAAALSLTAGAAFAQSGTATVTTDLNMRMGPGPQYVIMDTLTAETEVDLNGCIPSDGWCEVTAEGETGWVYSPYLTVDEQPVSEVTVTEVEYEDPGDEAAILGTGAGAAIGALVGGPVGAVVGGVASATAAGEAVDEDVVVYVEQNPVEPVILTGEPVPGVAIPQDVEVYDVPMSDQYVYLNVNGDTVVVDDSTREIVTVVR
ncbi:MAG TPA: hypothetical protein DEO85_08635 [Maritimibacter sp.]|nr:hypothetical protein [Maritimibacter sp.]